MVTAGITAVVAASAGFLYYKKRANRYRFTDEQSTKNLVLGFSENSLTLTKALAWHALKNNGNFLWVVDTGSFGSNFGDFTKHMAKAYQEQVQFLDILNEQSPGFNFIEDDGDKNTDTFSRVLELLDLKFGPIDEYTLEAADITLSQQDILAYKEMVLRALELTIQQGRSIQKEQTLLDVKELLMFGVAEFKTPYFSRIHDLVVNRLAQLVADPMFSIFCRTQHTTMIRRHELFTKSLIVDLDLTADKQREIVQTLMLYLRDNVTPARAYHKTTYTIFLNHYNVYKTDTLDKITHDLSGSFSKNNIGITIATEDLNGMATFANGAAHVYIVDSSWNANMASHETLLNTAITNSTENTKLRRGKLRYLNNTTQQTGEFFDLPKDVFNSLIKFFDH